MSKDALTLWLETLQQESEGDDMVEALAALEHNQWMSWAKSIINSEDITPERVERWRDLFVPYDQLTDDMKELDRQWARKVVDIVKSKSLTKWHNCEFL